MNRVHIAIICLVLFLGTYSCLLWSAYTAFIPDEAKMRDFIRHLNAYKDLTFTAYITSNVLMCLNYRSHIEKEILLTGLFSIIFITALNTVHKLSIYIMTTQLMLMLFNGITIAMLTLILIEGKRYGIFKNNG